MMHLLFKSLVLALVASSCLAMVSPIWNMDMDTEMDMMAEAIEDSLAVRMLGGEEDANPLVPIPEEARRLGLSTLVALLKKSGLNKTLSTQSNLTLFGPDNEAFSRLPEKMKKAIQNTTTLVNILKFHVLPAVVKSGSLKNNLLAATVQGQKLRINIYDKKGEDRKIYTAQCAPMELSRLDRPASNGVIHVLKGVMVPPAGNIVASLKACPVFKTLTAAIRAAELTRTLSGDGPFTLFAPTDDAFKKLPPGTIQKLLKNRKALANILKYHVVSGALCRAGLSRGSLKTVQGQNINLSVTLDSVTVNNAKVISADGSVTNGVVHAIDTVLMPKTFDFE